MKIVTLLDYVIAVLMVIILVLMTLHHRVIMITLARVKMPHVADDIPLDSIIQWTDEDYNEEMDDYYMEIE
jgi:hypothetical protein